jgi:hypothetical protein
VDKDMVSLKLSKEEIYLLRLVLVGAQDFVFAPDTMAKVNALRFKVSLLELDLVRA